MCELPWRDNEDEIEEPSKREEGSVGSTTVVLDETAFILLIAGLAIAV